MSFPTTINLRTILVLLLIAGSALCAVVKTKELPTRRVAATRDSKDARITVIFSPSANAAAINLAEIKREQQEEQQQQQQEQQQHLPLPLPLQLNIWQCRQRCYHQTLSQSASPALCLNRPDCYMCHDYCRVLAIAEWSLARAMCADRNFCSRGCRTACKFHRLETGGEIGAASDADNWANALAKA